MPYLFDNTSVQSLEIRRKQSLHEKNERSTNVLKVAGVRSTEQSGIIGVNFFDTYLIYFLLFQQ